MTHRPGAARPARAISGHHYSSLLSCPERAWLDLFADPRDRAPDPGYLVALQREGLEHERRASEEMFPDAVSVPLRQSPRARARGTLRAMAEGRPAILQAYLVAPGALGIADVLELVGEDAASPTGYRYRVGEFKRARTLKTAHALQLSWYDELLQEVQGASAGEAFVVLGDGRRRDIRLADCRDVYVEARDRLLALRGGAPRPGPHLVRECPACPWRALCLPALVEAEHVSLVPGISRERARALAQHEIRTWRQLAVRARADWRTIGIEPAEGARYERALEALSAGRPVLREPLRPGALAGVRAVALELARTAGEPRPVPIAVHWVGAGGAGAAPIARASDGNATADLGALADDGLLALYGEADYVGFQVLMRQSGMSGGRTLDLLDMVRSLVHAPLPGLELEAVAAHAVGARAAGALTGAARAAAIRTVLDWMDLPAEAVA